MFQSVNDLVMNTASERAIRIYDLGLVDYQATFQDMLKYTAQRCRDSEDRVLLLEHTPVYTQGTSCQQATFLPSDIEVVKTDRGGQITYHGPGQIVMYPLLDLKRHKLGVKRLVASLEQAVIAVLLQYGIEAARREDAPGVYVEGEKIAALGLRIRRGCSYHGLSFNIDMDLSPFQNIDPCGYQGLKVTQLCDLVDDKMRQDLSVKEIGHRVLAQFIQLL